MYKFLNGKKVYEKHEVDTAIASIVDDASTARALATEAKDTADEAYAIASTMQESVDQAIVKSDAAYNRVDSFNTVINTTLAAAANAVDAAMSAKTEIVNAVNAATSATTAATSATTAANNATEACVNALEAVAESDRKAATAITTANTALLNSSSAVTTSNTALQYANDAESKSSNALNTVTEINNLVPSEASDTNKLADKDYVNSSIATNTAVFRGTYISLEALEAYSGPKTPNDYAFVIVNDEGNTLYNRYKYNGTAWVYEYSLNNSSFTAEQWAAIQSGITSSLVELLRNGVNSSVPIGTILAIPNDVVPQNYLACNAGEYDTADYPELSAVLESIQVRIYEKLNLTRPEGKFRVPDYREVSLVGAGRSDIFYSTTDSIALGNYQDDQIQYHNHNYTDYNPQTVRPNSSAGYAWAGVTSSSPSTAKTTKSISELTSGEFIYEDGRTLEFRNLAVRVGATTHGKRAGVTYIIKATHYMNMPANAIDDTKTTTGNTWSAAFIMENIDSKIEAESEPVVTNMVKKELDDTLATRVNALNYTGFNTPIHQTGWWAEGHAPPLNNLPEYEFTLYVNATSSYTGAWKTVMTDMESLLNLEYNVLRITECISYGKGDGYAGSMMSVWARLTGSSTAHNLEVYHQSFTFIPEYIRIKFVLDLTSPRATASSNYTDSVTHYD